IPSTSGSCTSRWRATPSSWRCGPKTGSWRHEDARTMQRYRRPAMSTLIYQTITGRALDLGHLDESECAFLISVQRQYEKEPWWSGSGTWWAEVFRVAALPAESVLYRICQDLEARLGIAQGKVAPPDYRDYLADLIEERYGSRYRFCKETGVDPGHLSRVLASRSELSLQSLQHILVALHAALVVQRQEDVVERVSPAHAAKALAAAPCR